MATKLIVDSSADIPAALIEQYEIAVVPALVIIDGQELRSGVDITPTEFFERQRTARQLPKTSQPSPQQFADAFAHALKTHDRVLYIGISAGLSGTFNSAQQATSEFPADNSIVLHDSYTLSAAAGLQAIAAARTLDKGGTLEEALAAAKRTQQQAELLFSVDDLSFLIKGGRIGRVMGSIGTLFNIRPIIQVDKTQGIFAPTTRVRTFKAAVRKLLTQIETIVGRGQPGRFIILYGEMPEETDAFIKQLQKRFDVRWMHKVIPSPVMCAHTGPRALGVAFAPGDWEE